MLGFISVFSILLMYLLVLDLALSWLHIILIFQSQSHLLVLVYAFFFYNPTRISLELNYIYNLT
jgi:hypothetical protein